MPQPSPTHSVAVVGAGLAGAACAASLRATGLSVTVFDKSRGVGGRMSTRRTPWTATDGGIHQVEFDHGTQQFHARHPRFRAWLTRAEADGVVTRWRPRVHAAWPPSVGREAWLPVPNMPALSRHLLDGLDLRLHHQVHRLQRVRGGWQLVMTAGERTDTYRHVVLALPPAQAAVLLAGHLDAWADELAAVPVAPCWTLMALTNDVDWPWDVAEPARGPIGRVVRNDRKPGRSAPPGTASWVVQATPAWTLDHLAEDPQVVAGQLCTALRALLPGGSPVTWHLATAHRWRYAVARADTPAAPDCWWDPELGLGLCGDFLGGGDVEGAWRSGDELADTIAYSMEQADHVTEAACAPAPATSRSWA